MSVELRKKRRIISTVIFGVGFILLVFALVRIQLVNGSEYKSASKNLSVSTSTVKGTRGEIMDCNGKPLVSNRVGNSVVFKYSDFPSADKQENRNELIFSLIKLFEKNDIEWIDRLPLAYKGSGLVVDKNKKQEFEFMVSKNMLEMPNGKKSTADECLDALIKRYKLEGYSRVDARKIASVCFGMKYLAFSVANPYTFAQDVPTTVVSTIMEMKATYPGVVAESVSYREYIDKKSFSHILGVVGSISSEEYEKEKIKLDEKLGDDTLTPTQILEIKNNAYSLDDSYGKSGIEGAMEQYLRGVNGIKTTTIESDGSVKEDFLTKPHQGATVFTTIDSELQKVAFESLVKMLKNNRKSSYFDLAGAVVVLNCNTGEVLANVSVPTYDITRYFKDYNKLASDNSSPLWNRGFQSAYAPGSTLKPAIALASLEEEVIDENSVVYCNRNYAVKEQMFRCLNKHGYLNVTTALQKSCNVFFFEMGQKLGIDKMNKYCNLLGLGQKTGIELPEAEGMLASVANKEAMGQVWTIGDTVQAAIGQSDNLFTPLQLANYCATIANGGTRYQPYIIKSVLSSDMSTVIFETEPKVINTLNASKKNIDIVKRGMREVVLYGGSSIAFNNCKIPAAGKTGTSQLKRKTSSGVTMDCNNAFFISFAPYENPEIAIAVVAENAEAGYKAAPVAADIYNYYFGQKTKFQTEQAQNTLIP